MRGQLEDLYWNLHSLSKSLEGSGRIDESTCPEASATILDAMKALRWMQSKPWVHATTWRGLTKEERDEIYDTHEPYADLKAVEAKLKEKNGY